MILTKKILEKLVSVLQISILIFTISKKDMVPTSILYIYYFLSFWRRNDNVEILINFNISSIL